MSSHIVPSDPNKNLSSEGVLEAYNQEHGTSYTMDGWVIDPQGRLSQIHVREYKNRKEEATVTVVSTYYMSFDTKCHRADIVTDADRNKYMPLGVIDIESVSDVAQQYFDNPDAVLAQFQTEMETNSEETGLMATTSKAAVQSHHDKFLEIHKKAELLNRIATYEIEKQRQKMEALRQKVAGIVGKMSARLGYLENVLLQFEMYLGLYEEVITLKTGKPAPEDSPIYIIQDIMSMDEEVGDVELRNGVMGIDFQSTHVFDEWITRQYVLDHILPYEKCIVAFRPSRTYREYSDDPWRDSQLNANNDLLYLLIRNGENIHRIYGYLNAGKTLIPKTEDWQQILADIENAETEKDYLKAKNTQLRWNQRGALLQGILDRTTLLDPKPIGIGLFSEESYKNGNVVAVRNAEEVALPDGRVSFREWKENMNSTIQRGSRIYVGEHRTSGDVAINRYTGNFFNYFPPNPDAGVYKVEKVDSGRPKMYYSLELRYKILYLPNDEVYDPDSIYTWESRPRKRRIGYNLFESDEFVLNYDSLTLDDVEFYIGRRIERRKYQEILPILYQAYRELKQEKAKEDEFIEYFARVEGYSIESIKEAVQWWKSKNIWKRPISEDNKKAWRMIRKRLKG